MLPTEDEQSKILDAQMADPELPLGQAEEFLMTLSGIPDIRARLKLWLYMLDYANMESEIAEPLMYLKTAMHELETSHTFRDVMSTLLAIGNFLNGAESKGFQIDYLAKVPEVKDTVHKQSLVYHLCNIVMEKFPDSTDLYSELTAVARCARFDFDEMKGNLDRLEKDCKVSYDHLKVIYKHESHFQFDFDEMKGNLDRLEKDCKVSYDHLKVIYKHESHFQFDFDEMKGNLDRLEKDCKVS